MLTTYRKKYSFDQYLFRNNFNILLSAAVILAFQGVWNFQNMFNSTSGSAFGIAPFNHLDVIIEPEASYDQETGKTLTSSTNPQTPLKFENLQSFPKNIRDFNVRTHLSIFEEFRYRLFEGIFVSFILLSLLGIIAVYLIRY